MAKLFSPLKFLKIEIKVPKSKALPAYTASIHPVDSDQPQSVLQRYVFLFILCPFAPPIDVTLTFYSKFMSVYLRFVLLLLSLFFTGDIFAQVSFVDTLNLTNKTSGLKLWYLSENKYFLAETQDINVTLAIDSTQTGISLDSVLVKIQEFKNKYLLDAKHSEANARVKLFSIVLCLATTQFEMMEMRNLFERLSDMEIRVKVELPLMNKLDH